MPTSADVAAAQLQFLWSQAGMSANGLERVRLDVGEPTLPSSYHVAAVATAVIAAAGAAAAEIWRLRTGASQNVTVNSRHAEAEFKSSVHLGIGGTSDARLWGPIAGAYQCQDGRWVRIHANYPAHEKGVLDILECEATKDAVTAKLKDWTAQEFEDACGKRGLVVFMMRSADEWAQHAQGAALTGLPLFDIEKIGDAPPQPMPKLPAKGGLPLSGISVLDLTRVIAGPVCGRAMAAYGADVLRISAAHLPPDAPELEIDGGRGKTSRFVDLNEPKGRQRLEELLAHADVFAQGYRPGAIAAKGFSDERVAELKPGIVSVSISAWSHVGPWGQRRGFDSLVQTAAGINHGEAEAAGVDGPKTLPCQALDFASGYLMAFGAMAALHRRAQEGGSWRVRIALARTAEWLKSLPRIENGFEPQPPSAADLEDLIMPIESDYGALKVIRHPAILSATPARDDVPPMPYPR